MNNSTIYCDKIEGMLTGVALGDALGAPFEFRNSLPVTKYNGTLCYQNVMHSQFQGTRHMVIGQATDDTEMTLTLAHSLITEGKYDKNKLILSYETWANSGNIGMGTNTRALFKGIKTIRGYNSRYSKAMAGTLKGMKYDNLTLVQSNGSLMRCTPLALIPDEDEFLNAVKDDVYLTNPNPINYECNLIYLTAIRKLLAIDIDDNSKDTLETIWNEVKDKITESHLIEVISNIENGIDIDVTISKGWVVHAFYCAMYCLYQLVLNQDTEHDGNPKIKYQDLIDLIIRKGGDTDTNAAIAGGMVGSFWGIGKMKLEDRTASNLEVLKNADSSLGDFPREDMYRPTNLDDVSSKLYQVFN